MAPMICAINAVVVDFPFDPVTATSFGGWSISMLRVVAMLRKNRPMSLSTGTPAAKAAAIWRLGAG